MHNTVLRLCFVVLVVHLLLNFSVCGCVLWFCVFNGPSIAASFVSIFGLDSLIYRSDSHTCKSGPGARVWPPQSITSYCPHKKKREHFPSQEAVLKHLLMPWNKPISPFSPPRFTLFGLMRRPEAVTSPTPPPRDSTPNLFQPSTRHG